MTDHISAAAVAQFLQSNPDFFVEHADLFAGLDYLHSRRPPILHCDLSPGEPLMIDSRPSDLN